jgi:REP-associated tyrosine transposase
MARMARIVVPNIPHHVTQRGNRRLPVFFGDDDYRAYKALLSESCAEAGTKVWAYCLMPNHVHLILVPTHVDGLRAALGETHRRYTRHINAREGWQGHLWQSRFSSFPMDENYLLACARYIELNPVRAKLVRSPRTWAWSSAKAHLTGKSDDLVATAPLLDRVGDWKAFLGEGLTTEDTDAIHSHERTGHPLGGTRFLARLKRRLGRDVTPRKPGRPVSVKR